MTNARRYHLFSSQMLDDGDHVIGNPVAKAAKSPKQWGNGCDQALPFVAT
jgi:hypothetical protein